MSEAFTCLPFPFSQPPLSPHPQPHPSPNTFTAPASPPSLPRPPRTKQRKNMDDQAKEEAMKRARSIVASLGIKLSRPVQPAPTPIPSTTATSALHSFAPSTTSTVAASAPSNNYHIEGEEKEGASTSSSSSSLSSGAAAIQHAMPASSASTGHLKPFPPPESVLDKVQKVQEKLKESHAAFEKRRSCIDQVGRERGKDGGTEKGRGGEGRKGGARRIGIADRFPPSIPPYLPLSFLF